MFIQVISKVLVLILLLQLVLAESIDFDYPKEVEINEEFYVNLKLNDFPDDSYDVKVDINSENRIAKILNNNVWKSTFYYVNDMPLESELKMKIIEDFEKADILVKIRSKSGEVSTFGEYEIKKKQQEKEEQENEQEEEQEKETQEPDEIHELGEETIKNNPIETIKIDPILLRNNVKEKPDKTKKIKTISFFIFITAILLLALYFLGKKYKSL